LPVVPGLCHAVRVLPWNVLWPFIIASCLITISPGPAMALIIRHSAVHGVRSALIVLAGVEVGVLAWVLFAGIGVAGLVAASPTAFTVLKVAGAIVLVWLGFGAWKSSFRYQVPVEGVPVELPSSTKAFGTGAVTNLANPKAMVFCLAFLPQFIPVDAPVLATSAQLAVILVISDVIFFVSIAVVAHRAKAFFAKRRVRKTLDRVTGTVFFGLAARMATLAR